MERGSKQRKSIRRNEVKGSGIIAHVTLLIISVIFKKGYTSGTKYGINKRVHLNFHHWLEQPRDPMLKANWSISNNQTNAFLLFIHHRPVNSFFISDKSSCDFSAYLNNSTRTSFAALPFFNFFKTSLNSCISGASELMVLVQLYLLIFRHS